MICILCSIFCPPRTYPMFGFGYDMRAMTADGIMQMQFAQQAAMQNAVRSSNYCFGLAQFNPSNLYSTYQKVQAEKEKTLPARFADFSSRLSAAADKAAQAPRRWSVS